jgi:hypothetical protein
MTVWREGLGCTSMLSTITTARLQCFDNDQGMLRCEAASSVARKKMRIPIKFFRGAPAYYLSIKLKFIIEETLGRIVGAPPCGQCPVYQCFLP